MKEKKAVELTEEVASDQWREKGEEVEAIKFRLEQAGKDFRALIGVIGGRTRVYEVLRGKRPLSLNMIRRLHERFGIPASVLIQPGRKSRKGAGRGTSRRVRGTRAKRSV